MVAVPSIGRADRPQLAHSAPEADATRRLYEQYARQIYAYCLQQLRNKEEAEDATQSTFLNAFRGLQRGVDPEFESAWLYKIAQNVCLTRQRSSMRRGRVESPGDLDAIQDVLPAREVSSDELIGLPEALHGMPEQQRRALLLREWQGLTYREIAEELELSQAAVETLIFRARRTLAGGLSESGTRGRDLSSLVAILKSLLFTGGAKVAATVATVAATSVVAATPTARHAVEQAVVNLDPPQAKPAQVVHHVAPVPAKPVLARTRIAPASAAAVAKPAVKPAVKPRPASHPAAHHELAAPARRHALAGHVPTDPAPAPTVAEALPAPPVTPPAPTAEAPAPTPAPPAPAPAPSPRPAQPADAHKDGSGNANGNGDPHATRKTSIVAPILPTPVAAVPVAADAPAPDASLSAPSSPAPAPAVPATTTPAAPPPVTTTTATTPPPVPTPPHARSGIGGLLGP